MVSITLYVVENSDEAVTDEITDLVEFTHDDNECDNCGLVVGFSANRFFPCVVCVEHEDVWIVCLECAGGVIYPGQ